MTSGCPKCGSVYDLSAYEPGQRLRCRCGQIIVKPRTSPISHIAQTFHCSACGGTLAKGRADCPYCRAPIDMTHARLTEYCTSCLGMSKAGAKFCSECGKPLTAAIDTPVEADEACPRCAVAMRRRSVGSHRPLECPMCCGLFIDAPNLEQLVRDQQVRIEPSPTSKRGPEQAPLVSERVVYLKCPVCSTLMNRLNYGRVSGVIIDWCGQHGYWLDAGELDSISKWVASGGLEHQARRELEQLKAERSRLTAKRAASTELDKSSAAGGLLGFIASLFDPY